MMLKSSKKTMRRSWPSTLIITLVAVGLVACCHATVFAQALQPSAIQQIQAIMQDKLNRTPAQQKLDSHIHFAGQAARGAVTSSTMPSLPNMVDGLEFNEQGNVHVDIQGTVTPALLDAIVALGGTVESSFPDYGAMRAWIPLVAAETLAERSDVTFIKPAAKGTTNTRPVDTKALVSHAVDQVLNLGFTGSGVKVGVMSDGVNSLTTLQAAGNLPPTVTVLGGQAGSGDEGTAMLEIVYDLAPGAQLLYATAAAGEAQFATNIQNLAAAGCNIIVDDYTYYDEGAFQDGIIAQAVNTVTAGGVLYFSSAANSGNLDSGTSGTWEGDFVNSGTSIPIINTSEGKTVLVHAFDATHNYNQITAASSSNAWTTLKWSDPLGASCNDYDLFILDSTMSTVLKSSTNRQNCSQDPFEHVTAPDAGNRIVVVLYSGSTRALNVATHRGRLAIGTSGATFGHNAAASAVTLAATPAQSSIFTNGNQSPETYSSDGPRKIFYAPNGTAITPGNVLFSTNGGTTLAKTDFTAADCGQGVVPGFTTFCGTSAAAPVAAAIAALIKSANPALPSTQVVSLMKSTSLAAHTGFNPRTVGSGIVMANLAVAAARNVVSLTHNDFNGDGRSDILWRHIFGATALWFLNGTAVIGGGGLGVVPPDWTIAGVGDFNGDGKGDILWRHTSGAVALWFLNGTAVIGGGGLGVVPPDWTIAGVGDFNGDGKGDILWRHTSGAVALWFLNGTAVIGGGGLGIVPPDWTIAEVGDFNGDGKGDILWRHTSGAVALWFLNGTAVIGGGGLGIVPPDWTIAEVGDFNGDGKGDILWRHTSGAVALWFLNGTAVIGGGGLGVVPPDWTIAEVGDFNGDGKGDILWRHTSGAVALWFLNGTAVIGGGGLGVVPPDWRIIR